MSYPSADQIVAYLHAEVFPTLTGLPQYDDAGRVTNILDYEPGVVLTTPLLYTLFDRATRETKGQITMLRIRLLHRIVFQWQDNEACEQELRPFIHRVPAAIDLDPQLGGLITQGLAKVDEIVSGFVVISNEKFRCLDFFLDAPTKAPYKSGI